MHHAGLALVLAPVGLTGNRHDVGVMQQAVEQRCRHCCNLRKRGVSLPKGQIARHDQAALFVKCSDDLEEQIGLLTVHPQIANLIDDEQPLRLDRAVHDAFQVVLQVSRRQHQ